LLLLTALIRLKIYTIKTTKVLCLGFDFGTI
jgi:hypothetical protein